MEFYRNIIKLLFPRQVYDAKFGHKDTLFPPMTVLVTPMITISSKGKRERSISFELSKSKYNFFIRSALNIVDAKMEVGKRELAVENESFDWKSKKFLLVVTTWRSGSTFLSEMLASHPAVFLHYEPLNYFGRHQVRENENPVALQQLKDTFNCM